MMNISEFLRDEIGTTAIEYALIAFLISMAIIAGVMAVSGQVSRLYGEVAKAFQNLF